MNAPRKLHIAHVICTKKHAGTENYVGRIAAEFHRRGHQISVISRFPPSRFVPEGPLTFQVRNWREAARTLRKIECLDVVNSHGTEADAAAVWGLRQRPTPLVATHHFNHQRWSADDGQGTALLRVLPSRFQRKNGPLRSRMQSFIDDRVDLEVAVSNFVASRMARCDRVIPSGVQSQNELRDTADRREVVVMLQRLEPHKETRLALEAWARSSARDRGWKLEIYGEGSDHQQLVDFISDRRLSESVELKGFCDRPQAVLSEASLLLAPSLLEPFGLTILEAMSFGVPVIASASGGNSESVGLASSAALFPPGDVATFANLIDKLTLDEHARRRISEEQLLLQRSKFSIKSMCDQLEAAYYSALAGKTR